MSSQLSAEQRARMEQRLTAGLARLADPASGGPGDIRPRAAGHRSPASYAQRRLWFLDQLQPGSPAYLVPGVLRLTGPLDGPALAASLRSLVRRHEVLRTTFSDEGGELFQVVAGDDSCETGLSGLLEVTDLSGLSATGRAAAWPRLLAADAQPAGDLRRGPLLRARLLRWSADEHRLLMTLHHIAVDGWSLSLLVNDLASLYQAATSGAQEPAPPVLSYRDYTLWQRDQVAGHHLDAQLGYWERQLAGLCPTELPSDRPRPEVLSWHGARRYLTLDPAATAAVHETAAREASTPFTVLLAAFSALLQRYCRNDEIVLGTPVAGRTRPETEQIVGMIANTLVLRTDVSGDPTFRELVARTRDMVLDAYAHQDIPFELLVERLRPDRDPSRQPLFQIAFAMADLPPFRRVRAGSVLMETIDLAGDAAKFDLSVTASETAGQLRCEFEFSTDLFEPATIERLATHYQACLAAVLTDPALRISAIPLLGDVERNLLLNDWSGGHEQPAGPLVPDLVAQRVAGAPDAIAVSAPGGCISYRQLGAGADQVAARLRSLGCGAEDLVAVCADRSAELVMAQLGVLRSGAGYVPLDPAYPAERLAWQAADAGAAAILADDRSAPRFSGSRTPLLRIAEVLASPGPAAAPPAAAPPAAAPPAAAPPAAAPHPRQRAYVVYTSGSTGAPKGVAVEQAALANLVHWHLRRYDLSAADHVTLLASPGFDASAWELWTALAAGATLHVPGDDLRTEPAALAGWLADEGITVTFLPTVLATAVSAEPALRRGRLRHLLTGGDTLTGPVAGPPGATLVNHYGPTENTVVATAGEVQAASGGRPAIGRAIDNVRCYVLDPAGQPVPVGVPGELHLAGASVARGYLGDPARTAERFVPDPFSGQPGARLYRTGDLVRWLAGGGLDFLGRVDQQLKIRGFRVEPGEVEAALRDHPAVRDAVVLARGSSPALRDLVAVLVLADGMAEGGTAVPADELRAALHRRLPRHMVPAEFVAVPRIPVNAHGKVDRQAVSWRAGRPLRRRDAVEPPATPAEVAVAGLWAALLGVEQIDRQDNFFDLGGYSFLALRLHQLLAERFPAHPSVVEIFQHPTLAALAAHLDKLAAASPSRPAAAPAGGPDRARRAAEHRRGALAREYARRRPRPGGPPGPSAEPAPSGPDAGPARSRREP